MRKLLPERRNDCASPAQQQADAGKKSPSGIEVPSVQPIEKSGILPSAGSDGTSAAPTVQAGDKSITSAVECPMAPTHPNALPPGAAGADMPAASPAPPK